MKSRTGPRPDYLAHAVLLLGVLIFALPLWVTFAGATQSAGAINRGDISLIPRFSGLGNFITVLGSGATAQGGVPVGRMLLISFAMAISIAVGKIIISALSAFAIAFFRFPGRKLAFWLIFITLMLPVEVRIIPTYAVMADFHLINSFTGLTMPLIASATATLLFRQVFLAVPDELVEAAKLDGAGPMRFFFDILLPVSGANLAALFVILFVYGWNQYLWPLLVATNGKLDTIVLGIVQMISTDQMTPWNLVMAATIWAILPPVLVVIVMQRWFVRGLTDADK
jgi:sn-glycerol 3-phosphate transport system permease protein